MVFPETAVLPSGANDLLLYVSSVNSGLPNPLMAHKELNACGTEVHLMGISGINPESTDEKSELKRSAFDLRVPYFFLTLVFSSKALIIRRFSSM